MGAVYVVLFVAFATAELYVLGRGLPVGICWMLLAAWALLTIAAVALRPRD